MPECWFACPRKYTAVQQWHGRPALTCGERSRTSRVEVRPTTAGVSVQAFGFNRIINKSLVHLVYKKLPIFKRNDLSIDWHYDKL